MLQGVPTTKMYPQKSIASYQQSNWSVKQATFDLIAELRTRYPSWTFNHWEIFGIRGRPWISMDIQGYQWILMILIDIQISFRLQMKRVFNSEDCNQTNLDGQPRYFDLSIVSARVLTSFAMRDQDVTPTR